MKAAQTSTIMAIGAHHDDNELVAGTLLHHKQAGWRVVSVVLTNGTMIGGRPSPDHGAIRERESLAAAAMLGMESEFLRFPECDFDVTPATRGALLQVLRKHAPAIVVTHAPTDYHRDHIMASRLTADALFQVAAAAIRTTAPPCPRPRLYYADTWFTPFTPDTYVDVTEHMALKLDMLRCHTSQLPADGPRQGDMLDLARTQSRARGIEAGCDYAEGFAFVRALGSVRMQTLLC